MALTQITDVVIPKIYHKYQVELTKETDAFFTSGIVAEDAMIQAKLGQGGKTIVMPQWNDLDTTDSAGADTVTSDDNTSDISTYKVGSGEQIAVVLRRAVAFSSADIAADIAGSDPMLVVANRMTKYWQMRFQSALINTLTGVFANSAFKALALKSIVSDASTVPATAYFNFSDIVATKATMGDAMDDLKVIAVNTNLYAAMLKADDISFIPDSDNAAMIPTYFGMRVVVSDKIPNGTTISNTHPYTTAYLFTPGAIGYGEEMPRTPIAVDRDELAGDGAGIEYAVFRRNFVLHPKGFKFVATPGGDSPTNTELATGTSWTRVWERKNIGMAAFQCNY